MFPRSFSIIIPTYNRAYVLGEAIRSVLAQDGGHDVEIIVVDDGSTDDTVMLIEGFKDGRIRYLYQQNRCPSTARNLGIFHATKDWIVYLDSDNLFFPNYLDVLSRCLDENPIAQYVMVRAIKVNELYEGGKLLKQEADKENALQEVTLKDLLVVKKAYFDGNGFAHERALVGQNIRWDEKIKRLEDWEFLMQIAERYPDGFFYIPEPIVHYRRRFGTDGIISNSSYGDWADIYEYLYQKHKNDRCLEGQVWYPQRVLKYRQDQKDFEAGKMPPQHLRWFVH